MEMFLIFKDICDRNGLTYYLGGGSLLGETSGLYPLGRRFRRRYAAFRLREIQRNRDKRDKSANNGTMLRD